MTTVAPDWLWSVFILSVLVLLALDLFVFHRKSHQMKIKEALLWSLFWILLAVLFNFWFGYQFGSNLGLQFATGYLVELSLSVDNLFVMLLIFKSFRVPIVHQHRVLFWGIFGAIVMRFALILLGVDLVHKFSWIMYVFGIILISSAIKFMFESDEKKDVVDSWVVRAFRKFVPMTESIESHHFTVISNGVRKATPLLLVLCVIEVSDVIFAVDSIPAVLAVTNDAFVAFSSNIMAILGLRALYFVVADWADKFRYLKPGLSAILAFVGVKMLITDLMHIPSWVTLVVILFVLLTAGLTSWYSTRKSILKS
ncbi:MAG: TerC family protein [Bdellovibrionales bacterium]